MTALAVLASFGLLQWCVVRVYDTVRFRYFTPTQEIDPDELPPF